MTKKTTCDNICLSHREKCKKNIMEKYSRGRRGSPAKGVGRVTGARVQIPPSPPSDNNPNTYVRVVLFFVKNSLKHETKEKSAPLIYFFNCVLVFLIFVL